MSDSFPNCHDSAERELQNILVDAAIYQGEMLNRILGSLPHGEVTWRVVRSSSADDDDDDEPIEEVVTTGLRLRPTSVALPVVTGGGPGSATTPYQEAPNQDSDRREGEQEESEPTLTPSEQRIVEEMIVTSVREAKAEIDLSIDQRFSLLPGSLFSDESTTQDLVCTALSTTLVIASGAVTAGAGVVVLGTISRLGAAAAKTRFKNLIKEKFFSSLESAIGKGATYGAVATGLGWMGYGVSCLVFGTAP